MEAFFLESGAGRLFCVYRSAAGSTARQRGVILVPPFAEEMNMSRHTYSRLARELAKAGSAVLTIDLYGTGDSEGDFEDGRWQIWHSDVLAGMEWLQGRGAVSIDLLGLRLGGLLAMDVAVLQQDQVERVVLWNAVTNGRNYLNQFLRLRTLSNLSSDRSISETTREARALLDADQPVNVIGYQLAPELARNLDALNISDLGARCGSQIEWFEVVSAGTTNLSRGTNRILDRWQAEGVRVATHPVVDKAFWNMPGIEPHWGNELIATTVGTLA